MKNWSEQIRLSGASGSTYSEQKVIDGSGSVKIRNEKIYDTSSSADAFSAGTTVSVGDVIKMSGWPNYSEENNRIFTVTDKASDGEWIKVDKELKDVPESDVSSVTIEKSSSTLSVSGVTTDDVLTDVVVLETSASSTSEPSIDDYAITADDTVTHFDTGLASDDVLLVNWADMSKG